MAPEKLDELKVWESRTRGEGGFFLGIESS